jgi:Amt family ammonium transporter
LVQLGAALTVIVWDALVTVVILKVLGLFMKLRLPDEALDTGDLAVHDEEAYPDETLVTGHRPEAFATAPTAPVARHAESVES